MTEPYYFGHGVTVFHGDCLAVLKTMASASVDAVVTDPPYDLTNGTGGGFMGKEWDATGIAFRPDVWRECLRVLKPGGHLVSFGGARTWHRMVCAIEDAGFEIRDSVAYLFGSGFPKSLDVSKAIDREAGAERQVVGQRTDGRYAYGFTEQAKKALGGVVAEEMPGGFSGAMGQITAPATPEAAKWEGFGSALKPGHEPIALARKPLIGTIATNVLAHGTGALNIDATRIQFASEADATESAEKNRHADFGSGPRDNKIFGADNRDRAADGNYDPSRGRWPTNVVMDQATAEVLDGQTGERPSTGNNPSGVTIPTAAGILPYPNKRQGPLYDDAGGASRFFKVVEQVEDLEIRAFYTAKAGSSERPKVKDVQHATVKPLDLMRWLVRMVTPPGGVCLDPFAGSGTTAEACLLEDFRCITIEREAEYLPLIMARITRRRDAVAHTKLMKTEDSLPTLFDDL